MNLVLLSLQSLNGNISGGTVDLTSGKNTTITASNGVADNDKSIEMVLLIE